MSWKIREPCDGRLTVRVIARVPGERCQLDGALRLEEVADNETLARTQAHQRSHEPCRV